MANAVSGILSKTADTNPRPRVVFQDARGNFSTGIIEAISTRASRKMEPRSAPGSILQSGARKKVESRIAIQTAAPINGKRAAYSGNLRFVATFAARARARIRATIAIRTQSTRT